MPRVKSKLYKDFQIQGKGSASCSECDFQTNSEPAFNLHMKHIHKKKPPPQNFLCAVCGEVFQTKKGVNKHSLTHKALK